MNIKFENDLQNKVMKLNVSIQRRKTINKPRITLKWPDVEKLVEDQYVPPAGYKLGACSDMHKMIDNTEDLACEVTWHFELILQAKAAPRRNNTKTKTTRRRSSKRKE